MEKKTSFSEGNIKLRDGRRLAYAEYGDPNGKPIFFFHGTPGSRLFHHPDESVTASAGARIIAVDRPGFGRSDFKPGRTLLDWPNDVVQLADALNIGRFAVMGYSGGGPYAAVCASRISHRLSAAGLISSLAPLDSPEITRGMHGIGHTYFSLERYLPPLAKLGAWLMCTTWRYNPDLYFKAQLNSLHDSKEAQTTLFTLKAILTADFQEAVRGGTDGITQDLEILSRPWGFHLHAITANVFLWHGENDTQAPLAMGKRLAGAIPHCCATFFPREGHWAIYHHWREILTALARAEAPARPEAHTTIAVSSEDTSSGPPMAVTPVDCGANTPADSAQGLQPARPASDVIPATTPASTATIPAEVAAEDTAPLAEIPANVSLEPQPVQEAPQPTSRKVSKRRTAPVAKPPVAAPEPEPAQEAAKPVSKKTTKRKAAAVARTPAGTGPEPERVQEMPKPISQLTPKRAASSLSNASPLVAAEPKRLPEKAKRTAKRTVKPKVAVVGLPPMPATEESAPPAEMAEPVPAKPSSKRKATKETVPV